MNRIVQMLPLILFFFIIAGIIYFAVKQKTNNTNTGIMNKHYLQSQIKSSGTAYLLWFFFGFHYAYLGKWGTQISYTEKH